LHTVKKNLATTHRIAEIFPIIDISKEIIETFTGLKAELQQKGHPVDDMDLLIAATAMTINLVLVSNNEKLFNAFTAFILELEPVIAGRVQSAPQQARLLQFQITFSTQQYPEIFASKQTLRHFSELPIALLWRGMEALLAVAIPSQVQLGTEGK